jgi:hypothetical protein
MRMRARPGPMSFAKKDRTAGLKVIFKTGVVVEFDSKGWDAMSRTL